MPKETFVLLKKACGDKFLSNLSIKKWYKEFKDGWKSVHDAPRCSSPRTSVTEINTNTVACINEDDWHLSTRTLASLLNMSKISVNWILAQELKMKHVVTEVALGYPFAPNSAWASSLAALTWRVSGSMLLVICTHTNNFRFIWSHIFHNKKSKATKIMKTGDCKKYNSRQYFRKFDLCLTAVKWELLEVEILNLNLD